MEHITIACTSDWHVGSPNIKGDFPSEEELRESLRRALEENVDAYILAGDIVHRGSSKAANYAVEIIKPFIEQGLTVIAINGNHDLDRGTDTSVVSTIFSANGITMLEGESYLLQSKDEKQSLTIIGVSAETGQKNNQWWQHPEGKEKGWEAALAAATPHVADLQRELEQSQTEQVLLVTHRGIIAETVGTAARRGEKFSPQVAQFVPIINEFARRGKEITVVHGHDHTTGSEWEGFPEGTTEAGVLVYNVAAPVRRRLGRSLEKRLVFP